MPPELDTAAETPETAAPAADQGAGEGQDAASQTPEQPQIDYEAKWKESQAQIEAVRGESAREANRIASQWMQELARRNPAVRQAIYEAAYGAPPQNGNGRRDDGPKDPVEELREQVQQLQQGYGQLQGTQAQAEVMQWRRDMSGATADAMTRYPVFTDKTRGFAEELIASRILAAGRNADPDVIVHQTAQEMQGAMEAAAQAKAAGRAANRAATPPGIPGGLSGAATGAAGTPKDYTKESPKSDFARELQRIFESHRE